MNFTSLSPVSDLPGPAALQQFNPDEWRPQCLLFLKGSTDIWGCHSASGSYFDKYLLIYSQLSDVMHEVVEMWSDPV